ncbi:MAG TPA: adenosylcobalamin-dependent ribonucleoside-diphosphate reductase [Candidatus Nanoarchaeia archaeon]|nr:adenosylcobalamin-dependent ribonucleoside-diphosphate reductase [Candidatus Nanoarchaeia archaeon]
MVQKTVIMEGLIKRDGRVVEFHIDKITDAIFRAAQSVGGTDKELAKRLAEQVCQKLSEAEEREPTAEIVQDLVEKILIENGHAKTAKAYILYRHKKNEERKSSAFILGGSNVDENLSFSNQALKILDQRYLLKDETGGLIETPKQMLRRVAAAIAEVDKSYGANDLDLRQTENEFYLMMANLKFLPNSPTLVNAGTNVSQLSSCFVLPIEDSMESIFGSLKHAASIHQRGGGTGFSFSKLRPRGDKVKMHLGVASGPVSFMSVYDSALEVVKQGGIRPGANMAVLKVDHPDILRFIEAKRDKASLKNFNISVAVTDRFMKAVEEDREYYIKNPRTGKYIGKLRAKDVFSVIIQNAWKTGDPGLLFIDEINRKHPAKHLGEIETSNQCGEAPLLPWESCILGSIDVSKFVDFQNKEFLWEEFGQIVKTAVHFLDNCIDINKYLTPEIEEATKKTRKLGLGLMGFADMLYLLEIKYDSEDGLAMADKLMSYLKHVAYEKSMELAKQRGACPAWEGSDHQRTGQKMRNISCLALSPTGTRSVLADTSPGCEPNFALAYQSTMMGAGGYVFINKHFEKIAKLCDFYSPELVRKVSCSGNIKNLKEIPKDIRDVFVTAQDISPEWHIKMQATLQKHVDNAISKTINFPRTAAIKDVEKAYLLAWKAKCKGITIYRDGSYEDQVITIGD